MIGIYGIATTPVQAKTVAFSIAWYFFTGIGITAGGPAAARALLATARTHAAGYHRLWSHRAYETTPFIEFILALAGGGAVQGSAKWW
jgi:stearoyl-CoA desaturase (delta-9 desaturase)